MFLKKVKKGNKTYFMICQFDKEGKINTVFVNETIFNYLVSLDKYKLVELNH